jgi:hypothetical protein
MNKNKVYLRRRKITILIDKILRWGWEKNSDFA